MRKKILWALLILFIIIQFFRPEKNDSGDATHDITTQYNVPNDVAMTLKVACNDCHSNTTRYPWYANVQPVAWWLDHHVTDGKRHLNFSEFTNLPLAVQNHKFEETIEMVEEGEMPLPSYTAFGLHSDANLTDEQKQRLIQWAKNQMAFLQKTYPADSLVLKRRRAKSH
ncbi:MAG: heme-binding domain-containing protein [Flavobacteriaceae bacterium]